MAGGNSRLGRTHRIVGLVGIGVRRLLAKLLHTERRRVLLSISGVALAIAIMLIITGVSIGLSSQNTVGGENVDYWVVPESRSASTLVADAGSTQFGNSHVAGRTIASFDGVTYASPVLLELNRLRTTAGRSEYVLLIGVVAHDDLEVAGLKATPLTTGDPYYDNGSYNGTWTGDLVLSAAAADLLNVSSGAHLTVPGADATRPLQVVGIDEGDVSSGFGQVPVAVVHLSELQAMTGATTYDQADQILVGTSSPAVKSKLSGIYPNSRVLSRAGLNTQSMSSELPLAMALAALLVGVIVGTLFIGTTMGLEVTTDRQHYAVMGALGLTGRSRALVVVSQTLGVTVLGGLVGSALGIGGIVLTNRLVTQYFGVAAVARFEPILVGYALVVAVIIGVLTAPYLLWLSGRTSLIEELRGA
ncbi:MAG: ABC transporter permease [Halorhabdus sp.]